MLNFPEEGFAGSFFEAESHVAHADLKLTL